MEGTEKISSDKVRERIREDGFNAAKQAIEKTTDDLAKGGFDRGQVEVLVKEGAGRAARVTVKEAYDNS